MSKEYTFSVMPSVSISRSRFARKSQHKTSFDLGDIVPVYLDEVLPGDTRSIDVASVIRMATPIAPIMDNIYMDFFAFFVPMRLVWDHWKDFMGENRESAGIRSRSYRIPLVKVSSEAAGDLEILPGTLGSYLGLPCGQLYIQNSVTALPGRAYALIWNEWFRNQNIQAPLAINTGDSDEILVGEENDDTSLYIAPLLKANKLSDYFTRALPYAQKGAAVSIPLGTTAPIITGATHAISGPFFGYSGATSSNNVFMLGTKYTATGAGKMEVNTQATSGTYNDVDRTNLVADLRNATAATINQLRYAFQLQKLLEKDALYGTRYWEILAAHFGVEAPDASIQRPEYLGGKRVRINIDQVLSTAGYADTSSTDVGKPGAVSVTGSKHSLFTKSFCEHGYIFIMAVARHDRTYCQGINRMWTRLNRFDFYWPVFANLGAQEIRNREIYADGTSNDDAIFGYQEAWAEYRYKPSIASGLLNPSVSGSLDYWTLTDNYGSCPTLSDSWIAENGNSLGRCLATGFAGNNFIGDFYFQDIAVRPMPMYSIPGLIDHH